MLLELTQNVLHCNISNDQADMTFFDSWSTVGEYNQTRKLKLSTTKMVSAAFHFNSKEAKRELKVKYNNEPCPSAPSPNTSE